MAVNLSKNLPGTVPLAACIWLLTALVPAAGSTAEVERLQYRIAYGNFSLAEAQVLIRHLGDRYEVSGEGFTRGPLDWLYDWRGTARTFGTLDTGQMLPQWYESFGFWKGERREARLRWRSDRGVQLWTEPEPDPEKVTPVPAGTTDGTIDPFSAALLALAHFGRSGRCEGDMPVFDGRRRYNVLLHDLGPDRLVADRPWNYSGPAHRCRLEYRRIGGFFRDSDHNVDEKDISRQVWIAELAPATWRPVRVEIEAPIGSIVARAVLGPE